MKPSNKLPAGGVACCQSQAIQWVKSANLNEFVDLRQTYAEIIESLLLCVGSSVGALPGESYHSPVKRYPQAQTSESSDFSESDAVC